MASVVIGLVLIASLAPMVGFSAHDVLDPSRASAAGVPFRASAIDSDRSAFLRPFSPDSIWNLPIGADAVYVPANISKARAWGMTVDQDVIILTPNAPMTQVYYNDDAWNGESRCDVEGGRLFEAPIPESFVVPGARSGYTPNFSTAILSPDNRTLIQGQPMARCSEGATPTMWWAQTHEDLYGTGFSGAHGGSMLSSIGGTIRFGELVPGGAINHAIKVNLDGWANLYYDNATRGYRWPATASDSCASECYNGSNPALRMGSLLALTPDFDFNQLETEAARILARAFIDYGGYVVDNTGWSVYAIATEYSPQNGWLEDEFEAMWGFPIDPQSRNNPWSRDMDDIFLNLNVVDNWDAALWSTVSASNRTLGVGGGLARLEWAAEFGEIPPPDLAPPSASAQVSGDIGLYDWYRSAVTVSLNASDDNSGVAAIRHRMDGGTWTRYWWLPLTVAGDGRHRIEYFAIDIAGNEGPVQEIAFGIDTHAPTTKPALRGIIDGDGVYRSPVSVTLTATDSGSGVSRREFWTDGGTWSTYWMPFTVSGDGMHRVEYRATDVLGNVEKAGNVSFAIDTTTPITSHTLSGTLSSTGWYISSVTVTLAAMTPTGRPAMASYRLDGSPWVEYAAPFTLDEGRHVLVYKAVDSTGVATRERTVEIDIDYTPPVVRRAGTGVIRPEAPLVWTGLDSVSGIVGYEVTIDGGPLQTVGPEARLPGPWSEGLHVAVVKAVDAAGHETTERFSFTVDPDAPARIAIEPPDLLPSAVRTLILPALAVAAFALARGYAVYRMALRRRRDAASKEDVSPGESKESSDVDSTSESAPAQETADDTTNPIETDGSGTTPDEAPEETESVPSTPERSDAPEDTPRTSDEGAPLGKSE